MQVRRQPITLEDKLRYMREVESIHRLSKTTLPPQGKTWAQVADGILKKALGLQVVERPENFNISSGRHHQHSPRSARIIERTLRNGVVHPDVLHSYRGDYAPLQDYEKSARQSGGLEPVADTPAVAHYVQHGGTDLQYPDGHLQGYGFVPGTHNVASHVQLEQSVRPATDVVPTTAAGSYQ
jgi:hypothetical protein